MIEQKRLEKLEEQEEAERKRKEREEAERKKREEEEKERKRQEAERKRQEDIQRQREENERLARDGRRVRAERNRAGGAPAGKRGSPATGGLHGADTAEDPAQLVSARQRGRDSCARCVYGRCREAR